MSCWKYIL